MVFLIPRAEARGPHRRGLARVPQAAGGEAGVTPPHALALDFLGQGLCTSSLSASVFYFCGSEWAGRAAMTSCWSQPCSGLAV